MYYPQCPELEINMGFTGLEVKMWAGVLPSETLGESGPLTFSSSCGAPALGLETSTVFKSQHQQDPTTVISTGYSLPFNLRLPCGRTLVFDKPGSSRISSSL